MGNIIGDLIKKYPSVSVAILSSLPIALIFLILRLCLRRFSRKATENPFISVTFDNSRKTEDIGNVTGVMRCSAGIKVLYLIIMLMLASLPIILHYAEVNFEEPASYSLLLIPAVILLLIAKVFYRKVVFHDNGLIYYTGLRKLTMYYYEMQAIEPVFNCTVINFIIGPIYESSYRVLMQNNNRPINSMFRLYRLDRLPECLNYKDNPNITKYEFLYHPKV